MKRIFIDTNVLMDFIFMRQGCLDDEVEIFALGYEGKLVLIVSALSFVNTIYIAKHYDVSLENVKQSLLTLSKYIEIEGLSGENVCEMLESNWKDYEDSTQHRSAIDALAECIVTRNKKDFTLSEIPVLTPTEFLGSI